MALATRFTELAGCRVPTQQAGTRFVAATESGAHRLYKQAAQIIQSWCSP
jgi:NAD(P)H-dependent flavin oxidoreductase YrpB (nitropropane dioxygenase family)